MSKRYLSTSFWDDEWIQELDPSEKLLYLYLLTNPLTNIAGVYQITLRRICFDTGFNDDTVRRILGRFAVDGKAYLIDNYMIIPSFPKNQNLNNKNVFNGVRNEVQNLPKDILSLLPYLGYSIDTSTLFDSLEEYRMAIYDTSTLFDSLGHSSTLSNYLNLNLNINLNINLNKNLNIDLNKNLNLKREGNKNAVEDSSTALSDLTEGNKNLEDNVKTTIKDIENQSDNTNDLSSIVDEALNLNENSGQDNSSSLPENLKEKEKDSPKRFRKPTVEEVRTYIAEKGYTFGAEQFWNFYESKGWKVGNTPMKNWRSACATWQHRERSDGRNFQQIQADAVSESTMEMFSSMSDTLDDKGEDLF